MTAVRAAITPLYSEMMHRGNKLAGDGVRSARACFMLVVRLKEFVLQTIKLMAAARAHTMPQYWAMTRWGTKGAGDGARIAKECFTPVVQLKVRVLPLRANRQAGDGVGSARRCFTPAVQPKEFALWTLKLMTAA
jgi:hypothetical protein